MTDGETNTSIAVTVLYEYTWTTSIEYVPGKGWVANTSTVVLNETELRQRLFEAGIRLTKFRPGHAGFDEFRSYRTAWKVADTNTPPWTDTNEDDGFVLQEAVARRRAETAARSTRTGPDPDDEDPVFTTLPQIHCPNTADHDTHTDQAITYLCPGRHTPRARLATRPLAHPMDTDPFAGLE